MAEAPTLESRYAEITSSLRINILGIDQDLMAMPQLVQQAAELAADANADEHASKLAMDIIMAEASARLREPEEGQKARSETQIASQLILEPDVQAARQAYDESRLTSAKCSALLGSMRDKSRLLGKTCDLVVAGFITPSSYSPRRVALRASPSEPAPQGRAEPGGV